MIRVLFAGSCLGLALGAGPALAQENEPARSELMARCAQIQSDAARLACFDMVMRGGEAAALRTIEEANRNNPSAPVGTGTAPRMPSQTASSQAGAEETQASDFGRNDRGGLNLPGMPSVSVPSLPDFGRPFNNDGADLADAEASASGSAAIPDTQILERDDAGNPDRVLMVVERISTFGYNTKRFHMANGQVWEATDGFRFTVPRSDPLTAEIRTAGAGGYFLRFDGEGRAIRVRRID